MRRRRPRPRCAVIEVAREPARPASGPAVTMPTPGTRTTRGPAGSIGNWPRLLVEVALVVVAVPGRVLLDPARERGRQLGRVVRVGVELTTSGLCFVLIRWSGQGAPIWLTSGARTEEANATASGLRSTSSTTPSASASRAPRSAGRDVREEDARPLPRAPRLAGPPGRTGPAAAVDRPGGSRDEFDRGAVALLAASRPRSRARASRAAPPARCGCSSRSSRDAPRHLEPGPLVVEPDGLVAEGLRRELAAGAGSRSGRSPRRDACGRRAAPARTRAAGSRSTAAAGRGARRSAGGSRPSSRRPSRRVPSGSSSSRRRPANQRR